MSIKHKPFFWLQENLPYSPRKIVDSGSAQQPAINRGLADLPFIQTTTPCISTSFYRFLPTDDGDSVFMNTHQPDNRMKEFFGVKEVE